MKTTFVKFAALATAAVSAVSAVGAIAPVNAAAFGQREVTQDKFAVVAAPRGTTGTAHQLLILEQVSDAKACWSESGNSPTTIDPLLLTFNFAGICGRSTDSNGYSIRMAGQDLGMSYSLRMVHRNNDIVLVGVNDRDRSAPQVEIGRAGGKTSGFAKINLNSGWRLTKRVYDDKATGHVYLTNDLTLLDRPGGVIERSEVLFEEMLFGAGRPVLLPVPDAKPIGRVEKIVLADPEVAARLEGLTIRKVIVVKDRIVNLVAG